MKRSFLVSTFIFVCILLISGTQRENVLDQQKDYTVFSTVLTNKEGRLDLHKSQDSIQLYLNDLKSDLKYQKSIFEQYKLYSATISKLQCGHTQIFPTRQVKVEWLAARNALPLDMYLIGRRLIVGKLDSEDYRGLRSENPNFNKSKRLAEDSEILEIDEKTVSEMMLEMGKYISSDEGTVDFKYHQAASMFDFFHHMAMPYDKDSILVKYVTPELDTNQIYLKPGTAPFRSINIRLAENSSIYYENEDNLGQFKIVNNKYGFFRFKSFGPSSGSEYEEFLHKSFTTLKKEGIDKLIIDLRGNTGGVMQYSFMKYMVGEGVNLGRYVIEKPNSRSNKKYVSKLNLYYLRHAVMSMQQRKKKRKGEFNNGIMVTEYVNPGLVYDGEIVVITDEGTFSSASILACHLKTMKKAKIVGRTPGGSFYVGNAGTLIVKLPKSGFKIAVNPNTFYSHLDRVDDPIAIKRPDLYLDPMIIDPKERDQFYFKNAVSVFN